MNRCFIAALGCLLFACTSVIETPAEQEDPAPVSQPFILPLHQYAVVSDLLDGFSPFGGAWVFRSRGVRANDVIFELRDRQTGAQEALIGTLTLSNRADAKPGEVVTPSFVLRFDASVEVPRSRDLVASAQRRVHQRDSGGYYKRMLAQAPVEPEPEKGPEIQVEAVSLSPPGAVWIPLMVLAFIAFTVFYQCRKVRWSDLVSVHMKATHLLPAMLQLTLLAYWGLHWEGLFGHLHFILIELVFAYALEALLSLWVLRRWRLSFGVLPIVLSTNLFVQYDSLEELYMIAIALTVAVSSKILIRPGGRHVFNPSALGLAVLGVLWLCMDGSSDLYASRFWELPDGDIAHELALAPNMAEAILLAAMVAHLRVPVVLISLSAFIAMFLLGPLFQPVAPSAHWAPILLVLVLLITDPATSPRTPGGRLLFGFAVGSSILLLSVLLTVNGVSDFYAKVLPIPLANALVPTFDRLGHKLQERWRFIEARFNRWHVAAWFLVFVVSSLGSSTKPAFFLSDHALHRRNQTRFVTVNAQGEVTCKENAVHCSLFSFPDELACWLREGTDDACGNLRD